MLIDASVARSFAVIGWTRHLVQVTGGTILLADGVHGREPGDASELRNIRAALQRRVYQVGLGSGGESASGAVPERDAQAAYDMLQADDLHNLGGPSWIATQQPHLANSSDA